MKVAKLIGVDAAPWLGVIILTIFGIVVAFYALIDFEKDVAETFEDIDIGAGTGGTAERIVTNAVDIYDSFYVPFQKQLFQPDQRIEFEADVLNNRVFPRVKGEKVNIVDLAGGNAATMKVLRDSGKRDLYVTVLDQSRAMLGEAKRLHGDGGGVKQVRDTVVNPSALGAGKQDVATLLYFSVYQVKDKARLFENVNRWLKSRGVFVIHVVDRERFDPIADPASPFPMFSVQKQSKERVRDFEAKFNRQKQRFEMEPKNEAEQVIVEDFKPLKEGFVSRRNEHRLQMPSHPHIHGLVERAGFDLVDKVNMTKCQHEYQQLLVQMKRD